MYPSFHSTLTCELVAGPLLLTTNPAHTPTLLMADAIIILLRSVHLSIYRY